MRGSLFPPAKTYTVSCVDLCLKQLTLSFAQASSSSSVSASKPSFAVPSGSGASHSTDPSLPSMPASASSAVPSGPESVDSIPELLLSANQSSMPMRFCVMGGGGDPFDGDEDDGVASAKGEGRWEHAEWLTELYNSKREMIRAANGSVIFLLGSATVDGCQQTESTLKKCVLRRDDFIDRPRRAYDLNNSVFLIGVSYRRNNKKCNKKYWSWSPEVLNQLSSMLRSMFPFYLSHRCATTSIVWNNMRAVLQRGFGSKQYAHVLVTAHRAAHDRLELDYRLTIESRSQLPACYSRRLRRLR
ncbi:BQ5605_C021g09297 [Microbotryum silenes-dioicae]|uniref:BQ5605_C021g09297 protein n=1 Tax=Microbotryum silenes-dioicae TaxID=796604 RepID=A0A2X0MNH0_9BASI|nr:BQ5605_C021g09297 [Microbotryum silenes-dioicae]